MLRSKLLPVILILTILVSCSDDDTLELDGSLSSYLRTTELVSVNDLIACAANNLDTITNGNNDSVSIFFLPITGATNFRYFETEHADVDPNDHTIYHEKTLEDFPVFGGHLRKFMRGANTAKKWCIVTFEHGDSIFYSNPILLKSPELNTEFNASLLSIDQSDNLSPKFSWTDGIIDENVIYFQVISNEQDNLLTGTYTVEKTFQFYDLSNVVLNINEVEPPPVLTENETYYFTMMAVSIDNWVNLIIRVPFDTGQ